MKNLREGPKIHLCCWTESAYFCADQITQPIVQKKIITILLSIEWAKWPCPGLWNWVRNGIGTFAGARHTGSSRDPRRESSGCVRAIKLSDWPNYGDPLGNSFMSANVCLVPRIYDLLGRGVILSSISHVINGVNCPQFSYIVYFSRKIVSNCSSYLMYPSDIFYSLESSSSMISKKIVSTQILLYNM